MKNFSISNFMISDHSKPLIIAEISSNHKWSIRHTFKLIKKIKEAGAQAIKLQTYDENTMTIDSNKKNFIVQKGLWKNYSLYNLYKEAKTPLNWHKKIFDYAKSLGLIAFSTPFDEKSADFLSKLSVPAFKIASFEIVDHPLIAHVAKKKKPLIISTGMSSISEIEEALKVAKKEKNKKIILLHCISNYPAESEHYNVKMMLELKKKFKVHVGLSDHSQGNEVALTATALGAKIIEKHVKLTGDKTSHDSKFSMDTDQFKIFCTKINAVWKCLGESNFNSRKDKISKKYRRSIYVTQNIKKNQKITKKNIKKIRPGFGLHPKFYYKILSKKVNTNLSPGTAMKLKYII
jgi:pseudaminic acid synthase